MNTELSRFSMAAGSDRPSCRRPAGTLRTAMEAPALKPEEQNFQAAALAHLYPHDEDGESFAYQPDYDDEDYGRGYD